MVRTILSLSSCVETIAIVDTVFKLRCELRLMYIVRVYFVISEFNITALDCNSLNNSVNKINISNQIAFYPEFRFKLVRFAHTNSTKLTIVG